MTKLDMLIGSLAGVIDRQLKEKPKGNIPVILAPNVARKLSEIIKEHYRKMAHVKCKYTQYKCGNVIYGFTGEGCENQHLCDGCSWLDPQPGFLETTSKKVSWDGEILRIGNQFNAVNGYNSPYPPTANETIIESLEIDGQKYDL